MAEDFGGQLGQMWRSVYAQARQIADEQIKAALGNIVRGGKVVPAAIAPGAPGTVLTSPAGGGGTTWSAPGGGSGTVTSVGLAAPAELVVGGSPITAAGTLTLTKAVQAAGTVWAGPASGGSGAPTFRALVASDIPVATASAFGAVKPDGTTITISGGVITAVGGAGSDATTTTPGTVILDQAPASGHPQALTVPRLGAAAGVASLLSDGQVPLTQTAPRSVFYRPTTRRGSLLVHAPRAAIVLAAIGDSIYVQTPSGSTVPQLVAAQVAAITGQAVTVVNRAISGTYSTQWVPGASTGYFDAALPAMVAGGATHCMIMLGTNDSVDTFATTQTAYQAHMAAMCAALLAAGIVPILNCPPYAVPGSGAHSVASLALLKQYAAARANLANLHLAHLGDTGAYDAFLANTGLLSDGIHPTATGQSVLAGLVASALVPILSEPLVELPIGAAGQVPTVNGTGDGYIFATPAAPTPPPPPTGAATRLAGLTDVYLNNLQDGDSLSFALALGAWTNSSAGFGWAIVDDRTGVGVVDNTTGLGIIADPLPVALVSDISGFAVTNDTTGAIVVAG